MHIDLKAGFIELETFVDSLLQLLWIWLGLILAASSHWIRQSWWSRGYAWWSWHAHGMINEYLRGSRFSVFFGHLRKPWHKSMCPTILTSHVSSWLHVALSEGKMGAALVCCPATEGPALVLMFVDVFFSALYKLFWWFDGDESLNLDTLRVETIDQLTVLNLRHFMTSCDTGIELSICSIFSEGGSAVGFQIWLCAARRRCSAERQLSEYWCWRWVTTHGIPRIPSHPTLLYL